MMTILDIHLNGDNCWPDLLKKGWITGRLTAIASLPNGMASGKSSVTIRVELPDGQIVLAETSLALLNQALAAFYAAETQEQGR